MKSSILKQFAIVAIVCVAAVSCKDNDIVYDRNFDGKELRSVNFAAPIANVHVPVYKSIKKWMDLDSLSSDETGLIYVSFTHTQNVEWTNDIGVDELRKRFDYPLITTGDNPFTSIVIPGGLSWTKEGSETIKLTTNEGDDGTKIDSITFHNGLLEFDITLPSPLTGEIEITIPGLTINGVAFTVKQSLTSGSNNRISTLLTNGKIKTTSQGLPILYKITVTTGSTLPSGSVGLNVHLDIASEDLNSMFGYFGKIEASPESEEVTFDFFEALDLKQDIGLKDIIIKADIVNSTGLPMMVEVSSIKMFKDNLDLGEKPLTVTPEFKLEQVEPATYENGRVTPVTTHKEVKADLEFSNGKFPNKLVFKVVGTGNPNGATAKPNFLVKNDQLNLVDVNLEILVPLHFKTGLYERQDTVDFDFNDMIDDDENLSKSIENLVLHLDINNGLPFEIALKGIAIDENEDDIVTLIPEQKIESAGGTTGKATPVLTHLEVKVDQAQIDQLRRKSAKKIILITKSATYNQGADYVKIHNDAALDINVSLSLKANIPSSLF
ncbi:MAG: hypothetical protein LBU62_05895 [Bacteroidales bacterium]|jgi:hypothetical protein|nr:hypothetical protein [Bacteroidales bacterium]